MAGSLSQTLIRESRYLARDLSPSTRVLYGGRSGGIARSPPSRLLGVRLRSGRPELGQYLEAEVAHADPSSIEVQVLSFKKLEDAIQSLLMQKLAPSWIPFVPGSSYWIPIILRGRVVPGPGIPSQPEKSLTVEEELSRTTRLGWPSSSYFVDGIMPDHSSTKILTKSAAGSKILTKSAAGSAPQSDEEE